MTESQELIIDEERPAVSKARLLVFLLAALANAISIPSGAIVINAVFSNHVLSTDCSKHLLSTEEHGLRQLNKECNNEYRILIRRLEDHINADQDILDTIAIEEERRRN